MRLFDFSYSFPKSIEEMDKFSGKEFEVFLFEYFDVMGCNPRLTNDTDDKGVDLMVDIEQQNSEIHRVGIQAKRWKGSIGVNEIRKMLDGKAHYNLDKLWIVSTSKLTSSATSTAKNNRINILNREHVIGFLNDLKKIDGIKFMSDKKEKVIESKSEVINKNNYEVSSDLESKLKKFRIEIYKRESISKIYLVFNNKTLLEICSKLPTTIQELNGIAGIGPKKVELFGKELLEIIIESKNNVKDIIPDELLKKRSRFLIGVRKRIAKFNSIEKVEECFDNSSLERIAIELPKNRANLKDMNVLTEKNLELFGDYLLKRISEMK